MHNVCLPSTRFPWHETRFPESCRWFAYIRAHNPISVFYIHTRSACTRHYYRYLLHNTIQLHSSCIIRSCVRTVWCNNDDDDNLVSIMQKIKNNVPTCITIIIIVTYSDKSFVTTYKDRKPRFFFIYLYYLFITARQLYNNICIHYITFDLYTVYR